MSKEAGFLETIIQDPKGVSSTTVSASKKDELKTMPSLFDTMLKDVKEVNVAQNNAVANEKTVTTQEIPKSENLNATPTTQQVNVDKNVSLDAVPENKNNASPLSLLDRLINEASEQIKSDDVAVNTKLDSIQNGATPEIISDESISTGVTNPVSADKLLVTKEETIPSEKTPKAETTSLSSLIDVAEDEKVLVENLTSIPELDESKNANNDVEIKNETKEVVKTDTELPLKTVAKDNVVENVAAVKENTTLSLLDKLVNDANLQIQKETTPVVTTQAETVQNVNKVEVVETADVKQIDTQKLVQGETQKVLEETNVIKILETTQNSANTVENVKVATTLVQTKVETTPIVSTVNDKIAEELAKVSDVLNEKTSLTKEQLENVKTQTKETSKSLLDQLMDETKITITAEDESIQTKTQAPITSAKVTTDPVLTNIYLSSVNKISKDAFLEKNQEGKTIVANATSVKDVQKGADLLNLGLDSAEVVQEEEFKQNVKNEFLNKLSINRDIVKHDIVKMNEEIIAQNNILQKKVTGLTMSDVLASKNLPEIELNVSSANAYSIENRIIGARQQMGSMMSDLARNMYLNYKPPITAFRMNLNPGNLGSIAVLIKNDKDNGLSISLNMSNVATLDSIVDNQGALRAALAKNFNTNANINLEFNMQDGKQQGSNSNNQQNKRQQQNHRATNDILESLNSQNESKKVTNYM